MRKVVDCSWMAAGLLAAALVTACETDPLGPVPPSLLEARIEGSVTSDYQGTSVFSTMQRGPVGFMLRSVGHGPWSNEGFQFIAAAMPAAGSYALGQSGAEIRAQYSIREGNTLKRFVAESGELVVTASSAGRLEGTFHFRGRLGSECDVSRPNLVSCTIVPAGEGQPTIEVSGSIDAVADRTPIRIVRP